MTSCLALTNFEGERFPSKLVFGEATKVFHGYLIDFIAVLRYREVFFSFYCRTFSQPFPVFMVYSCSWKDCALGELLCSLGELLMVHF